MLASLMCLALGQNTLDERLYADLRWRCIGPHRGGRTVGAAGIAGQPNTFLIGVNNGGVWKTDDAGRTWKPIFDDQPTGSIGALDIAPSDPNTYYVGCGEGLQRPDLSVGNGMYKSIDAGKTWSYLGLGDAQQIGAVLIDRRDANRVFVAVLGHPYGPNAERGVYRTTDGGTTWKQVLYKDENTGAIALVADPRDPDTLYADLWAARQAPWENGSWQGPNSGLFKSTDGGDTWRQLTTGLPTTAQGLGRIGIAVAPSYPKRLYATVDAPAALGGVYRSDDAGESWRKVNGDGRIWGRGSDFAEVKVHPKDPDTIFVANTAAYRSTDGGQTFTCIKGAPGGDDYHTIWINPDHPDTMLFCSDQGATITVNGGLTWSSWYNQPTAQFYHVSTDNQWPYWVYGGQQESGSVGISSRGNDGQITFREWHPVGAEEYGYVAADPLDPNLIYGGKITKYDKRTGQVQDIAPEAVRSGKYRFLRTAPVLFSPVDPKTLYFAGNVLFKTRDGGSSWEVISPDLSREHPEIPECVGVYRAEQTSLPRRGVIYAVAPSYIDAKVIWAGTDDGLVHVTRDGGKTWKDVTPPVLSSWDKVSQIDAGHFDVDTATIAVNRIRCDDQKPHIYRTRDGGKTWTQIVAGLPDDPINTVREDPVRAGLLYCGSERMVHFSLDEGASWHPLRMNMPCTSIRDLVVHEDDLVVGTHGRSFWILDDVTILRQLSPKSADFEANLYKPQLATRVRWNMNTDTPLPPEEPGGQNPPDGAIIDYWLGKDQAEVTLEVLDSAGRVVRRYSSSDKPDVVDPNTQPYPVYWFRPSAVLPATAGHHRWIWNLHYARLGAGRSYPMTAIVGDTPLMPVGPWTMPGTFRVRLTAGSTRLEQPLTLRMDPRVKTPMSALQKQHDIALGSYDALQWFSAQPQARQTELARLAGGFSSLLGSVEDADVLPTQAQQEAYETLKKQFEALKKA